MPEPDMRPFENVTAPAARTTPSASVYETRSVSTVSPSFDVNWTWPERTYDESPLPPSPRSDLTTSTRAGSDAALEGERDGDRERDRAQREQQPRAPLPGSHGVARSSNRAFSSPDISKGQLDKGLTIVLILFEGERDVECGFVLGEEVVPLRGAPRDCPEDAPLLP